MASTSDNKHTLSDDASWTPAPKRHKGAPLDKRYTDEYVPITVLHVTSKSNMLGENIGNYFSKFGTVLDINPFKDRRYHGNQNDAVFAFLDWRKAPNFSALKAYPDWYVRFADAEAAARVLCTNHQEALGQMVQIKPADNWLHAGDPEPCVRPEILSRHKPSYKPNTKCPHITDLPIKCMARIFSFLLNTDLCSAADTCVQFNQITQQIFSETIVTMLMDLERQTLANIKMLPIFGQQMTEVHMFCGSIDNDYECQLKSNYFHRLITAYCPNLKVLEWPQRRIPSVPLFTNMKRLQHLEVNCYNNSALEVVTKMDCLKVVRQLTVSAGAIDKTFYQRMVTLPQLRSLHLLNMKNMLVLDDLAVVKQLEEIKIAGKCKIGEKNLVQLVIDLPKLKMLEFENVKYSLTDRAYLRLVAIRRCRAQDQKLILRISDSNPIAIPRSEEAANKKYVEYEPSKWPICRIQ